MATHVALLLAGLGVARPGLAEPVPRVHYDAAAECPTRDDFLARMRARMSADKARMPAEISLRVTVTVQGGKTHGTVEIQRGASSTRRSVDGARCEEVVEALALIAALAAREDDPRLRARKPDKPPGTARPSTRRPTPSTDSSKPERSRTDQHETGTQRPESSDDNGAPALTGTRDPGTPSRSSAGRDQASEQRPESSDDHAAPADRARESASVGRGQAPVRRPEASGGSGAPALVDRPGSREPAGLDEAADRRLESSVDGAALAAADGGGSTTHRPEAAPRFSAGVAATALLFSGLAPALQPGLQLQAALMLSTGELIWSLQLGGRIAQSDQLASQEGDARFGFAGGVVRLCAAHALGSTPLRLSGCAVAEPGVHSAAGENTRNRRSHSRLWLALGAAADLSLQLAPWLSLRAGAELLAPFRRDRIWLAGDALYHVPALGFRWYLGLEVPFG